MRQYPNSQLSYLRHCLKYYERRIEECLKGQEVLRTTNNFQPKPGPQKDFMEAPYSNLAEKQQTPTIKKLQEF